MKLPARTFRIYWDVHAWAGVVPSLLLFIMFFAAPFALVHDELDAWSEPDVVLEATTEPPRLGPLFEQLATEENALGANRIGFSLEGPTVRASFFHERESHAYLQPRPGARLVPSRSKLGSFLYELHYLGPIPYGIYVAGVAALALFVALVTGILLHLKDLVRHGFQMRPERPLRTWASDMHKVLGVFGLPYQLLYAWTGAVICLAFGTAEPAFVATVLRGDRVVMEAARGEMDPPKAIGRRAERLPDLDALVVTAKAAVPGLAPTYVGVHHAGDEASSVTVYGDVGGVAYASARVLVGASDGHVLAATGPANATTLQRWESWFYGLHYAHDSGYFLKILYALLSLATCLVILTGNLVWIERRDPDRAHAGNRFLERITIGVCTGMFLATAAIFLASRALPAALAHRETLESALFGAMLALATTAPFGFPRALSPRRVGGATLFLASGLFATVLVVDVMRPRTALTTSVDVALVVYSVLSAALARSYVKATKTPVRMAAPSTLTA